MKTWHRNLLDELISASSRTVRRGILDRLATLGPAVGPFVVARLKDERWFVIRNLLHVLHATESDLRNVNVAGFQGHSDARVRRALTMAIDRQKLIRVLSGGRGEIAVGPVPSFHWSYDANIKALPYSVDSARAELAGAGIRDTNGDGTLDLPNGSPFQIELKLPANNPFNRDMAEMIRADLAIIGVKLVTRPTEFSTLIADVMSPERKFQAVLMAWVNDFRLVIYDNYHSGSINNPLQFASYRNPQVDSLLDVVQRTTTRDAALPAWRLAFWSRSAGAARRA